MRMMHNGRTAITGIVMILAVLLSLETLADDAPVIPRKLTLLPQKAKDQDDMCFWVHPTDPALSTIITADKAANCLFVYDLKGDLLQRLEVSKPGNIDTRQRCLLSGQTLDLVVCNQRAKGEQIRIWKVQPETRLLEPISTNIPTGPNYGGCLYHSSKTGRLYFISTSKKHGIAQYEITSEQPGHLAGQLVRKWPLGFSEGAVADDEAGTLYISVESEGVWKFGAEPEEEAVGELIIKVGKHRLRGDVEGLAIYKTGPASGYLLLSDQGRNRFQLYQRDGGHQYVGEFSVENVRVTDGIEAMNVTGLPGFAGGLFACHTDPAPCAIVVVPWQEISQGLSLAH